MRDVYAPPSSYRLIYAYAIPGSADHAGLVKVGSATLKSFEPPTALRPMCPALVEAARARIDQQTNTAGVKYDLLHCELAVREVAQGQNRYLAPFEDHDVHAVLEHSGFRHVKVPGTKAREWYRVDLETVKKAIWATKEGRVALNSNDLVPPVPFTFREEQERAITQTLARFKKHTDMLWDAKMRFGKTPTALEVVRRGAFRRTIIITHRPVVATSWKEDFGKIFPQNETPYEFIDRFSVAGASSARDEAAKKRLLESYDRNKRHFIYFASIQDLRGSKRLGGEFLKNDSVFDLAWDLVIIDEAHEGTQTALGQKVSAALAKPGRTRVLSLSGTPFNILESYKDDDAVFVWDYTMEQKTKREWESKHPDRPNPYATLPKMNILTFDLSKALAEYAEEELEGKAFNFTEFFRTWTGNREMDGRSLPAGVKAGSFVHADDVRTFLDLISTSSSETNYPFATPQHCDCFRHSLWMVPGVAEAKALSAMLQRHPVFGSFGIANVAGKGDDFEEEHFDNALELVRETIRKYPRSITLSCGKLTTGVTVPEWTAVMMLAGSVHTSAASYLQTIFRVQSPWVHEGQMKEACYVFDFAPDRTLTVLTEAAQLSRRVRKNEAEEERGRAALGEFLNYCSVVAMEGGRSRPYDVREMMRRLRQVFVMKAIRNGFDDPAIYNNDKLLKLGRVDLMKFDGLKGIVGQSKQTQSLNGVSLAENGFNEEEWERRKSAEEKRKGRKLSPEEEAARKKHLEDLRKARDAREILRAISIRMPLLIYGADVPFDETISIRRFVALVDDASWAEFMPKGVTKAIFNRFVEYYDAVVFEAAGIEIRKLAKAAERLPPGRRVQQIARIFGYFKNPDKETVLTPWRVVNLHLSDTLGGWRFEEGQDEPHFVDRGAVTKRVFAPEAKVLEINSKSGLYPLYVAYSVYRARCGEIAEEDIAEIARAKKWREVLRENVFVICKTPMAASITRRTLAGYSSAPVNAVCWKGDFVETLKTNPIAFTSAVKQGTFWGKKEKKMEFDAVVGNPPYQQNVGKIKENYGLAIYGLFVDAAKTMRPSYVSMIMPSRWFTGGRGLDEFRDRMLNDRRNRLIVDFQDATECFPGVDLSGGVSYFLWDRDHEGDCKFVSVINGTRQETVRQLNEFGNVFPRHNAALSILRKIKTRNESSMCEMVSTQTPFGFVSTFLGREKPFAGAIRLVGSKGDTYVSVNEVRRNADLIGTYKLIISKAMAEHAGSPDRNGQYRVISTNKIIGPGDVCTQSYLFVVAMKKRTEVENCWTYLKSRFFRFLLLMSLSSQDLSREKFMFVPIQDFTEPWTDEKLYKKYGITPAEQKFIESMIKPMA